MNPRTYLRLLHPVHAVVWTAFLTGFLISFGVSWFKLAPATSRLLGLAIGMPFVFGLCLATTAHAAMHRPFFLLLPDGLRRVRRATIITLLIVAPLMSAGVARFQNLPFIAELGLAAALLSLPLTNPRGLMVKFSSSWAVRIFGAGCLCYVLFKEQLAPAMQAAPWIFLLGGLGIAFICLQHAFAPQGLRQRAQTPYNSVGGYFLGVLNFRASRRYQEEIRQEIGRRRTFEPLPGQDWTVRRVGPDVWSWMQVFRHATFAVGRKGSYLRSQYSVVVVLVFYVSLLPLFGIFDGGTGRAHSFTLADYWSFLANFGSYDIAATGSAHTSGLTFLTVLLQAGFCATVSQFVIRPQLAYPISRLQLARVVFSQSLVQLALALVLPAFTLFLISLAGQIISGHFLPALGLPPLLLLDFGLLPLLPLLACAGSARSSIRRILLVLPVVFAIFIVACTRSLWRDRILTLPGLALILLVTATTLLLLRSRLIRHYGTCDLTEELGFNNLTGSSFASRR
jgi:hypothetical protein